MACGSLGRLPQAAPPVSLVGHSSHAFLPSHVRATYWQVFRHVTKESLDSWRVSDLIPSTTVESPTLARYILSFLMMHTDAVVPAVLRSCICLCLGFQVVSIKRWRKIFV